MVARRCVGVGVGLSPHFASACPDSCQVAGSVAAMDRLRLRPPGTSCWPSAAAVLFAVLTSVLVLATGDAKAGWDPDERVGGAGANIDPGRYAVLRDGTGAYVTVWTSAAGIFSSISANGSWPAGTAVATVDQGREATGAPLLAATTSGLLAVWFECDPKQGEYYPPCTVKSSALESGSWTTPVVVVANDALPEDAALGVDANGVATISWVTSRDDQGGTNYGLRRVRVATGSNSSGWSWSSATTYNTGGFIRATRVLSYIGGALVVWHEDGYASMRYVRRAAATWSSSPLLVSSDSADWGAGFSSRAELAVDSAGVVTAVWNETAYDWNVNPGGQTHVVRAARLDLTSTGIDTEGVWSPPVLLTPDDPQGAGVFEGYEPDVAASGVGVVTAVWAGNQDLRDGRDHVYASTFDGTGWSVPERISGGTRGSGYGGFSNVRIHGLDAGAVAAWADDLSKTYVNHLHDSGGSPAQWLTPLLSGSAGANVQIAGSGSVTQEGWPQSVAVLRGTIPDGVAADGFVTSRLYAPSTLTAVVNPTVVADYASIRVSWEPPANDGNWSVRYVASADNGQSSCETYDLACTITGLANGTQYTVTVEAIGDGPQAATASAGATTPLAQDGWVGPLHDVGAGVGVRWDGTTGTAAIGQSATGTASLVTYYVSDDSGPAYVTKVLNGDGGASALPARRIALTGPAAYWSGSPAVRGIPGTDDWIVFYYEGPSGFDNGGSCDETDGSESAGAVKAIVVASDGSAGAPTPIIPGICAAGTLSAQWDAVRGRFLVAGAISVAGDGRKLRGRFVGPAGDPQGQSAFALSSVSAGAQSDLAFSVESRRYLAVTYRNGGLTAVLLDEDGIQVSGVGSPKAIAASDSPGSVAYDVGADEFVLVWGGGSDAVEAQRVDASSFAVSAQVIDVASGLQGTGRPAAVGNTVTGDVVVSWHAVRGAHQYVDSAVVSSGSNVRSATIVTLTTPIDFAARPALAFDAGQCLYRVAMTGIVNEPNLPSPTPPANTANSIFERAVSASCATNTLEIQRIGGGVITGSASGVDCGTVCAYDLGTTRTVALAAQAPSGWVFDGWGGHCSGAGACIVSMDADRSVTATFSPQVAVTTNGSGAGSVTSSPSGVDCGSSCLATYAMGSSVVLTADAAPGSVFAGWSGACTGLGACSLSMSEPRSVAATFLTARDLTVTKAGAGAGAVTSTPAGIDCGATCVAQVGDGLEITLTATAASGSVFAGWSGACSGSGICTITMSEARSVTATFDVAPASQSGPGASAAPQPGQPKPTSTIRLRGSARQVGNTIITEVDVTGAGTIRQSGWVNAGGRKILACRATMKAKRPGRVTLRCAINKRVLRVASRSVRVTIAVPVELRTTFVPTGGTPSTTTSTAIVRAVPERASIVTG